MPDTMTITEAAARFRASARTVRRTLELDTQEGRDRAHAGYDASGRTLLRAEVVEAKASEREMRGNWRVENLGHWAQPRATRRAPTAKPARRVDSKRNGSTPRTRP